MNLRPQQFKAYININFNPLHLGLSAVSLTLSRITWFPWGTSLGHAVSSKKHSGFWSHIFSLVGSHTWFCTAAFFLFDEWITQKHSQILSSCLFKKHNCPDIHFHHANPCFPNKRILCTEPGTFTEPKIIGQRISIILSVF